MGGIGSYLGDEIYKLTNTETRVTVLGHVQRGAQPTHRDRLIASAFGVYAVDLIAKEKYNRIVVWQNRNVTDIDIDSIAGQSKTIHKNDPLIKVAQRSRHLCGGSLLKFCSFANKIKIYSVW